MKTEKKVSSRKGQMMSVTKSAKTIDEAVKLALDELNVDISCVDVNVIEKPKSGFLGFGSRDALVEVTLKDEKIEMSKETCCKEENNIDKNEYIEKFDDYFPNMALSEDKEVEIIEKCLKEGKDAYELGYFKLDANIRY